MPDTRWLDNLPSDYLAAQPLVLQRLGLFASPEFTRDRRALLELMAIDAHCRTGIADLSRQYVSAQALPFDTDELLWNAVSGYQAALAAAYQGFFNHYSAQASRCDFVDILPQLLLNLADCHRCVAKWHYLRYQSVAEGFWTNLHRIYLCGERQSCAVTAVRRHPDGQAGSLTGVYLEALMLDTLNRSNMLKIEIDMVSDWLAGWSAKMALEPRFDEGRYLFFVNLDEDRGGRRLRNFTPTDSCRYWETDAIMQDVETAQHELEQGRAPSVLTLAPGLALADCQRLLAHLQAEWSRHDYQRQRRTEEREGVVKRAQVVNGILNVCQHVKNVAYAAGSPRQEGVTADLAQHSGFGGTDDVGFADDEREKWVIENESRYGFGAVADADLNFWLQPGKLVALDCELSLDIAMVGVVRSIKRLPGNKLYVGMEVLSHTPAYVRLRGISAEETPQDLLTTTVFPTPPLDAAFGDPPFPALYLPRDDEQGLPSTLLVPVLDFVARGHFELRWDRHNYRVRFGRVVEQKDDWVRVEVLMEKKLS